MFCFLALCLDFLEQNNFITIISYQNALYPNLNNYPIELSHNQKGQKTSLLCPCQLDTLEYIQQPSIK